VVSRWTLVVALCALLATAVAVVLVASHQRRSHGDRAPEHVLGRLGAAPSVPVRPVQSPAKVKLGPSTRTAIAVPLPSSFEADIDPATTRLTFSMGARGEAQSPDVVFVIGADNDGHWRTVFTEVVQPTSTWLDRRLDLQALSPGSRKLRFQVGAAQPTAAPVEPFWGSVAVLGPDRPRVSLLASVREAPPNVILISLDTLGADHLSSFGNLPSVSPEIDDILQQSFSFRRAYAQYPNTPVSHASIFTGLYPRHHGMYETSPHLQSETLADVLAAHGYVTVAITEDAFVSSDFGFDYGFDWYDNGVEQTVNADDKTIGNAKGTFEKAEAWLTEYAGRAPFFLFVHTYEVHAPYTPRDEEARAVADAIDPGYKGPFEREYPCGLWELGHNTGVHSMPEHEVARLPALYAGEINYLDRIVGSFMQQLASLPAADRTLVVLTADHGEEFNEHGKLGHGETLFNHVLHVPLGFYWPGKIASGTSEAPVELIDIMPTVLDLLSVKAPPNLDGTSLRPVISGKPSGVADRPVLSELHTAFGDCRRLHLEGTCVVDRVAVQTADFKFMSSQIPQFEVLYDLGRDPGETHDVIQDFPAEATRYRTLAQRYAAEQPQQAFPAAAPTAAMDEETRERLRALGYLK
jgi:arylsulfatase A-like enzyme